MVPDNSAGIPRAPTYSGVSLAFGKNAGYGTLTPCGAAFQPLPLSLSSIASLRDPITPPDALRRRRFGLFPVRSPLLGKSLFTFFSCGYLDVSVPRVRLPPYGRDDRLAPAGLPHSEIRESKGICPSSRLIAACHVLLRLREPRHPPYALVCLFICFLRSFALFFTLCDLRLVYSLSRPPFFRRRGKLAASFSRGPVRNQVPSSMSMYSFSLRVPGGGVQPSPPEFYCGSPWQS